MRQTTLSVEVAHFTHDEPKLFFASVWIRSAHHGPTWLAVETTIQTSVPVSILRVKEGHIRI